MASEGPEDFAPWLARWRLQSDGEPIVTHGSRLLPVRRDGAPAMLKLALAEEERRGRLLMCWWNGQGAARVLESDEQALLLERATGSGSLAGMVRGGRDDEASRLLCAVAAQLHSVGNSLPSPELIALPRWFASLFPMASTHGGILERCAATALELLADPCDSVALHGDLHHDNVLDFGARGWLAIDPKCLHGERGFDFANLFCNPRNFDAVCTSARLSRQADVVAEAARLERRRLLQWILAYAGLSAAWTLDEGGEATPALAVAGLAAAELDRS